MKKKFQKITSVNFVVPDPRLLEIGAKWRTLWALKLKIKKIKGVRGLAQETQPSDLYPCARKFDTWIQKRSSKIANKNSFLVGKIKPGIGNELVLSIKSVLEDILIYHLRLIENFFFWKKKFQKITSVNFLGPDPRLLEIGAKWHTLWALKLKIKKNKGCQRAGSRGTALWPVPICPKICLTTKKIINSCFCWKNSTRMWKRAGLINKNCLKGYFDLSSKTYRDFFLKKKFQKITRIYSVGPDPKFLKIGAKWRKF